MAPSVTPSPATMNIKTRLIVLLPLLLSACASQAPRPAVTAPHPATPTTLLPRAGQATLPVKPAANDLLNATVWAQRSAEHHYVYTEIYRVARQKLLTALQHPNWDALPKDERSGSLQGLKPAVILDVDETVLDNSPYQARLIRDGSEFNPTSWASWCREMRAKPLPGALQYTRFAASHGVTVFYLTNRSSNLGPATLQNLRHDGFPVAGPKVFLGRGTYVQGCKKNPADKRCRRILIGRNYRVLQMFGDQLSDFVSTTGTTEATRMQQLQAYATWFGNRWFLLPNPMYGGWLSVLFQHDQAMSPGQRRKVIEAALQRARNGSTTGRGQVPQH